MTPSNNVALVASAGSGKTTRIVAEALSYKSKKILITTYTNENVRNIEQEFYAQNGCVPSNVDVLPWFTFLLRNGCKPYQNLLIDDLRIQSINFDAQRNKLLSKSNLRPYYVDSASNLYSDYVSDFASNVNTTTNGLVIGRLETIYDQVYVDEVQDLCGYDLEILNDLLKSKVEIFLAGDPRQATFRTNYSAKNKQYARDKIVDWFGKKSEEKLLTIEQQAVSYRCIQSICDFSDALYPHLPKTESKNDRSTDHDGIFCIKKGELDEYIKTHNPMLLKYDARTKTHGHTANNIGKLKGRTYDRVLVFTTGTMRKYLSTKKPEDAGDLAKLYIASTRARFSVAFLID